MKRFGLGILSAILSISMVGCTTARSDDESSTISEVTTVTETEEISTTDNTTEEITEIETETEKETVTESATETETELETEDYSSYIYSSDYSFYESVDETTTAEKETTKPNNSPKPEEAKPTEKPTRDPNVKTEDIDNTINKLNYKGGSVPRVFINTAGKYGQKLDKVNGYVDASVLIESLDGTKIREDNTALVKVRGNSTSRGGKKPYTIKFTDKQNVFGMGEAKKWVLLADFFDPSLMRNYIALTTAKQLGLAYTSEKQYVEVWIDGIYVGSYLLTEAVEDGKSRVDIKKSEGEFLIQLEDNRSEAGKTYIATSMGYRFMIVEPETPTKEQLKNIKTVLNNFEAALRSKKWSAVSKLIDAESFAKYILVLDYFMTVDMRISSVYFYYKNGKLYAGPAWDFDLSMGNSFVEDLRRYDFSRMHECCWFEKLIGFEVFPMYVKGQFISHQSYFEKLAAKGGLIDSLLSQYSAIYYANFHYTGFTPLHTNCAYTSKPAPTHEGNVKILKDWLNGRYKWYSGYMDRVSGVIIPETTEAPTEPPVKETTAKATEAPTKAPTTAQTTEVKTTEAKTTEAKTTEAKTTEAETTEPEVTVEPTTLQEDTETTEIIETQSTTEAITDFGDKETEETAAEAENSSVDI